MVQKSKTFFLVGSLLLLLCVPAVVPLFHPGFFTMHDDQQIARLYELNLILHQGQIPPRWVPDLGFGYGYPLFDFYPPLVYYLGFLVHSVGFGFITSTKIVMGLGFFLSSLFMFLWSKKRFGFFPGLVASILYIYAPYHMVDIYVRGAFAEFFSFVWIPGAFWAFDVLSEKRNWWWMLISSLFLSGIFLTHDLVAMQSGFFVIGYGLFVLYEQREYFWKLAFWFVAAALLTLGLTSYFWLPSLVDKQYTLVDAILTKDLANYQVHFVCIKQLWNSPWGYGGSVPECNDGLTFEIGKVHLIGVLLSIVGIVFLFWKKKKQKLDFILFLLGSFLFATFLTTSKSAFVWAHLGPFAYIQFPWRFLLFSVLYASILTASVVWMVSTYLSKKIGWGVGVGLCLIAFFLLLPDIHPQQYLAKTDADYTNYFDIAWRVSRSSYEYVPKEVATMKSDIDTTLVAIDPSGIAHSPFAIVSGQGSGFVEKNLASEKIFHFILSTPGVVRLNTYAYPGWTIFVDGGKSLYTSNNKLHLMQVSLSEGDHTIVAQFKETPVRLASDWMSIFSLTLLLLISGIFCINHLQLKKKR